MAASVSSSATVSQGISPVLTKENLTTLFAAAPESLTRLQLTQLLQYCTLRAEAEVPSAILGQIFVPGASSASISGSKTVTVDVNPTHLAAKITIIFATPIEKLTFGDITFLKNCCSCKAQGEDPNILLGSLFN